MSVIFPQDFSVRAVAELLLKNGDSIQTCTDSVYKDMQSDSTEIVIARVRAALETVQASELERLYVRLPTLPGTSREEIRQFSNRLVQQFLDPPLKSLCDEASDNTPHQLLEAFQQLFQFDRSVGAGPRATILSTVTS